jgi:hypothetical protein
MCHLLFHFDYIIATNGLSSTPNYDPWTLLNWITCKLVKSGIKYSIGLEEAGIAWEQAGGLARFCILKHFDLRHPSAFCIFTKRQGFLIRPTSFQS